MQAYWDQHTDQYFTRYPVHCEYRYQPLAEPLLHAHEGYELYLCLQGTGAYTAGTDMFPITGGTLTILPPRLLHRPHAYETGPFHRIVCSISEAYMHELTARFSGIGEALPVLRDDKGKAAHYFLNSEALQEAEALLRELERELQEQRPLLDLAVYPLVCRFLLLLCRMETGEITHAPAKTEEQRICEQILTVLRARFRDPLTIEEVCRLFPLSRTRLFELFKQTTGHTMHQYVVSCRLHHVKQLLLETRLPVTSVASESGFGDISHFFHLFRKETGMTPRKYRELGRRREPEERG